MLAERQIEHKFLTDGGEVSRRIAAHDWSSTPLGPIDTWPSTLKQTISLMLPNPVPLVLLWGSHGVMIYNDAYSAFAGGRDSRLLGSNVREGWDEIAEFNDHIMRVGLAGGTLSYRDHELTLHRDGRPEQVWMDLDYSPVRGDDGEPAGVLAIVVETTEAVRARRLLEESERKLRFFDELSRAVADRRGASEVLAITTRMTAEHLGLSNCAYADMDRDQNAFTIRGNWHAPGSPSILGHYDLADFGKRAVEDLQAGRPLIIDDVREELAPDEARTFQDIGVAATICMPLIKRKRLTALMAIHDREPRVWSEYELSVIREVTERSWAHIQRVGAEDNLRESEERLRHAQVAGGVGLFSIDIATSMISATPEFCRIFGLEPDGPITTDAIESLVISEDKDIISNDERRQSGEALLDVEYRIRRPDTGEVRIIARKGEYERDENGRPVRLVGAVQDATERRRIQKALELSEAQFSALAQNMPNHVWTARSDGKLDWFNDRIYAYIGADPSKGGLDSDSWTRVVHPDDVPLASQRWEESVRTGQIYETEFRLRGGDGNYRWFLARALPLTDKKGAITAWVGTNTEIEAQKRAEEASAQDRDRLWAISQDLMMVSDFDGIIKAVNPSARRLLGWSETEMVGSRIADFLHAEDQEATSREVSSLARGRTTLAFENRYRCKDDSYRLLAWTAVPGEGRIHAIARDITEQRAVEEALRQSQKMEAVGQLTGGIAHDFNNLLQGITGSLDVLGKRLSQGRLDDVNRWLLGAKASAERAAALTHRLLAFSRRQPLDPRPVRANPLASSMEDLLRRTLGESIKLELVLAGGLWLTRCDPNQLESAILNLAINARDAMPDGGTLTIETCNAHLDSHYAARQRDLKPGQYVCISVTDSGTGMDQETLAKAFEPFFTTKPVGQGTGLGLSMIYGFTRQSEGYARIYSEVGEGTTVKLYLPRYFGQADEDEHTPGLEEAPEAGTGEVVLVIEDEAVVRGLIVDVLEELGYQAIEAENGQKGLDILQSSRRVDLLVTDIGLPGLNGRDVVRNGRIARPDLKVLFMTGYAENAALASGFLEPGMAMITKPFAMEALANRIRDIIEG
ncbi:PAS domain-containing protein [Pacificimonas sp. ICDLI1SI03]